MRVMLALYIVLSFSLLGSSVGIQARSESMTLWHKHTPIPFEEDFKDWVLGPLPSDSFVEYVIARNWQYDWLFEGDVPMMEASSLLKGGRSLRFFRHRADLFSRKINISTQVSKLVLEVVLKVESVFHSNLSASIIGIVESAHAQSAGNLLNLSRSGLQVIPDMMVILTSSGSVMVQGMRIFEFRTDIWYTLKIVCDLDGKSASIFFDNKLVQETYLESNMASALDPCFLVFSYNQSMLLDSVKIFEPTFRLVLNSNNGGSTQPSSPQTLDLAKGASITVWAEPDEGYFFAYWIYNNTCALSGNPFHTEMNQSLILTPVFSKVRIQPPASVYTQPWFLFLLLLALIAIGVSAYPHISGTWAERRTACQREKNRHHMRQFDNATCMTK